MPLSDTQIRTAKPKTKTYKMFDTDGLYVEITPKGKKYWRLKFYLHKVEKRISLGVYPITGLAEARLKKNSIRKDLETGIDPTLKQLEQRQLGAISQIQTFEAIAKEWHAKNIAQWDPRYAQTVMHRLEKYTFLEIGSYPITQLKPLLVLACLKKIEATAPEMARRVKQLCSHIFKYAIATGRIENDITYGLECALRKYKKGNFASIDVDELPKLIDTVQNHRARLYRQTYLAMWMMLLTFVRTRELVEARWAEVDLDKAIWTIPAERMKMRRPHLVPLSSHAIEIFKELQIMNGKREHVFPSIPRPQKPMSKGTILIALKRMGYSKLMTGHGFRSLANGVLKEKLGYSQELVDRQLAHAPKSAVTRAYDRAYLLPQRTEMMCKYSEYLNRLKSKA